MLQTGCARGRWPIIPSLELPRPLLRTRFILDAREDAFAIVEKDPGLDQHLVLRNVIAAALDDEQAAYLGRG